LKLTPKSFLKFSFILFVVFLGSSTSSTTVSSSSGTSVTSVFTVLFSTIGNADPEPTGLESPTTASALASTCALACFFFSSSSSSTISKPSGTISTFSFIYIHII
jgi:hypothetical protein